MTLPSFASRVRSGPPAIGTLVSLNSAEVAEALSLCGFDWLFIDMEHGPLDIAAAQDLVRATAGRCSALVRVPENSAVWIKRVLDTGADGIIVPSVCSAEEALRAADAARYPEAGHRSVGIGRAHDYGLAFGEYVASANERVTVVVQIEHITGVERLNEILDVPGIDAILIGPYDLSGSMNLLGQVKHPDVQAAIHSVRTRCAQRGMPVGIFVVNPDDAVDQLAAGASFLAIGTDLTLMCASASRALQTARGSQ